MGSVKGPDYSYRTHTDVPAQFHQAAQKYPPFLRLHKAAEGKYSMVASSEIPPWTEIKKRPGHTRKTFLGDPGNANAQDYNQWKKLFIARF